MKTTSARTSIDFGNAFRPGPAIVNLLETVETVRQQTTDVVPEVKRMGEEFQRELDLLGIRPELIAEQAEYAQAVVEFLTTMLYDSGVIADRPKRLRYVMPPPKY